MTEHVSEAEAFELYLHNLLEWLHVMTLPPIELCDTWGNYNVAWELINDIRTDGISVVTMSCSYLTENQKQQVHAFINSLDDVPQSLLVSATSVAANQEAMSHPCWGTYRESAAELIRVLEPSAKRNREFFTH